MSGGYLEEWHIHNKNCPYFLTFYKVMGWVLNPAKRSPRLPNFNHSVAVERWSVVCVPLIQTSHPTTSLALTACDEVYQAFPMVSVLQVTNAGVRRPVYKAHSLLSLASARWLSTNSSKHNMWKPIIWCEPEWGSVCRGPWEWGNNISLGNWTRNYSIELELLVLQ